MGIGAPGAEQFRDAIVEMRNQHVIFAMGFLMDLRQELVSNDEFKVRGGFDDTTRDHFLKLLQTCDKARRVVTYCPNRAGLADRIKAAIDTSKVIAIAYAKKGAKDQLLSGQPADVPLSPDMQPFGGDEVQGAPGLMRQVPWALDGTDEDIPLNSKLNFRSNGGFLLLQAVDAAIVSWTRIESRHNTRFITVGDSMRMYATYVQILEYLLVFGGDVNRVDFAAGVRPSEEPRGSANSPNMLSEKAGESGITTEG
jgi:hypothetical protein